MKTIYVILAASTIFLSPAAAVAADTQVKQEVEKIASAYADSFNKHDAAGIAALYANGGVLVNPAGPHSELKNMSKVRSRRGSTTRR